MCCSKCSKGCGTLLLLFGVLFLIDDLTSWEFWFEWYTVAFILAGLALYGMSCCRDCQSCCGGSAPAKTSKKK